MHSLQILSSAFFDICRLRLRPQNLPASSVLLGLTLLLYLVVTGILSLMQFPVKEAMLLTLIETGLLVVLTSSLLYITHYATRITQTITALAGTNSLLGIFTFPPLLWINFYNGDVSLPVLLLLGLIAWNFVIHAHILRHALAVSFFMGFNLTLIIQLLTFSIINQLVPFTK
ncbi:MAG: hypothetical protein ABFS56_22650 [Pseudomonadota bacterium]